MSVIAYLANLIIVTNAVIASGKFNNLDPLEVREQILNHTVQDFLKSKIDPMPDNMGEFIRRLEDQPGEAMALNEALGGWAAAYHPFSEQVGYIEQNGLCLLVAYATVAISHRV